MKDECGAEKIGNLFTDKAVLTDTCCIELVAIGKACRLAMVNMALSLPVFKPYASLVLHFFPGANSYGISVWL